MELENEQQFIDHIGSTEKVIVKYGATWCNPCKTIIPMLNEAEKRSPGKFLSIDIDKFPDIAAQYNISSIPALLVFQDGKEVSRKVGVPRSFLEVLNMIK